MYETQSKFKVIELGGYQVDSETLETLIESLSNNTPSHISEDDSLSKEIQVERILQNIADRAVEDFIETWVNRQW
jgi:hypothetical protein